MSTMRWDLKPLKYRQNGDIMIDLHIHTTASDGSDSPKELLERIIQAGIRVFSVTDHDSTASCREIERLIREQKNAGGKELPSFLYGVEFSCEDEQGKYHILGYAYDITKGHVLELTKETHAIRMLKLERRLNYIKETFGISFPEAELSALRKLNNPGKPHIGNLLVKYGHAADRSEAIRRFLNPYSPPEGHIRPEAAIRAILADGGIPVLAHAIYGDGDQLIMGEELTERVRRLKDFGLLGLECFYSGFVPKQQMLMLGLADQFDLYVTAGSDYHGSNKLIPLGDTGFDPESDANPRLEAFLKEALKEQ